MKRRELVNLEAQNSVPIFLKIQQTNRVEFRAEIREGSDETVFMHSSSSATLLFHTFYLTNLSYLLRHGKLVLNTNFAKYHNFYLYI